MTIDYNLLKKEVKSMEEEYQKRIEAVRRYYSGQRANYIYKSLCKPKQWLYFWLKRYNPKDENWYKDKPKSNKIIHNKIDPKIENLVCNIRKRLSNTKYAQRGALAIQWELKRLGVKPIPIWTINRIIKRNNLVKKPEIYERRNKIYPSIEVNAPCVLHQLDIIGPRYLGRGKANKFFSINLIDAFSNVVKIKPCQSKRDIFVTEFLVSAWQKLGIPKYLQVDNELSFKGSNRHLQTFGNVIKLCLYLGVEIIFIPEAEPWRQGVVEKFNDVFDKIFFRSQIFEDFNHLSRESVIFENFHNNNHRYGKLKGKTPWTVHTSVARRLLPTDFSLHKRYIPFKDGRISFIRLTDEEGKVRFFTETFLIDKELVNEYVKATIFTKPELLKFYYDNKVIKIYKYTINKH
jgi:hypothetical protein